MSVLVYRKLINICLFINFIILFSNPVGAAAVLNPASFIESVSVYNSHASGTSPDLAESISVNPIFNRGTGSAFARADATYPVVAEVGVDLAGKDSPAAFGGSGDVQIVYQFSIEALSPGLPDIVPIDLSAAGYVSVDAQSEGVGSQTFARVDFPGGQWQASNCDPWGCYNGEFSFSERVDLDLAVDTAYTVRMYALTHGQGAGLDFSYLGYAMIDPEIVIDPGFTLGDQYRIVYSAGVNQVPLPTPFLLMGSALVLLGVLRRRVGPD